MAFWDSWRRPKARLFTESEVSSAIDNVVDEVVHDMIHEASADRQLAIDDVGWTAMGVSPVEIPEDLRARTVAISRVMSRRDSLCKQLVRLYTNFGIGTGVKWNTDNAAVHAALERVWTDPGNKVVFGVQGQRALSDDLCTDGELFLAVFEGNPARIRPMDPLEITCLCTDPDDSYTETQYVREWYDLRTHAQKRAVYQAATNPGSIPGLDEAGHEVVADPDTPIVLHVRLDRNRGRGDPLLMAVVEWAMANRIFMGSRMAVIQEIQRLARKVKVKGGPRAVDESRARQEARIAARSAGDMPERGATFFHNDQVDTDITKQETGASSAQIDDAMILRRAGSGAGVFPHYLGAGEAFRLATATSMEPPMLRNFEVYQALLEDTFMRIFDLALEPLGLKATGTVELDPVEIWPTDRATSMEIISQALDRKPELALTEPVMKQILSLVGIKDPDAVYDDYRELLEKPPEPKEPKGAKGEPKDEEQEESAATLIQKLRNATRSFA